MLYFSKRILLGMIIATSFLTMWLNNAGIYNNKYNFWCKILLLIKHSSIATTAMMLPLALSIVKEINSSNETNENECLTIENNEYLYVECFVNIHIYIKIIQFI